ncbi:MAG TPA: (Fe-S)-binding protein [Myxococcota bacterium]|nr:(Fe-S)-binding protein [Myxococcota bacterium]
MKTKEMQIIRPPCDLSCEVVNIKLTLDQDLSELLPYINREVEKARFFPKGPFTKFVHQGHNVTIDHDNLAMTGFEDDTAAREFAAQMIDMLRDIEARKDSITPQIKPFEPPSMLAILRLLPGKNGCAECGYPACMAFATALCREETTPDACKPLALLPDGAARLERLREMTA